ncbi:MAG: fructose-1,6-bisphosphatase [Clostridiaceae bacterium]|jgi:fructose-1,6-bisphosphatase-3|nr:fructose-1,6-bisphosphatase [Clostridiaceae bacterium]
MQYQKYLRLLAKEYPTARLARGEIIRLAALRELPKGTEYFFSDLHGEAGAFIHLLRSASGNIRTKIRELYQNTLTEESQNRLANLIYDPPRILQIMRKSDRLTQEWIRITITRLTSLLQYISSKYPQAIVREHMPAEYVNVLYELLYSSAEGQSKHDYVNTIVQFVIDTDASEDFIAAICGMIQRICVNNLHIIGDIYDRGPGPHRIMEELIDFDRVDIQWGNHDVVWMGAASGSLACMANVLRVGISYNTFDCLEEGYGINLRQLSTFAAEVYGDDPCERFMPKLLDENIYSFVDEQLTAKMHKAISIIQFKLEGQLLDRNPEFAMDDRNVLKKVDFEKGVYVVDGVEHPMLDTNFPTVDPKDPLRLTDAEQELMHAIDASFRHSEPLQRHINFFYSHGGTYKIVNGNLLFHGCIPMSEDGEFQECIINGRAYAGKALLDQINLITQRAFFSATESEQPSYAADFMWYLWCGPRSPMFGKSKMATFEGFFVDNKELRKEKMNDYYRLSEDQGICDKIFREFGMDPDISHIINGHVPVKIKDGETPVKANGKLFVIDGGISKAYQPRTGIAGYTMIFNSHHLALAEHTSFDQIENDDGSYTPKIQIVVPMPRRLKIADIDLGDELEEKINDLRALIDAYRNGVLKERITDS